MISVKLVILNDSNANKYISLLRKKTSKSISEIKQNISMGKPFIVCDYYNERELKFLVSVAEELLSMGACIKILEDNEEITIEMVRNLMETIEGVAKDREEMDSIMLSDDTEY